MPTTPTLTHNGINHYGKPATVTDIRYTSFGCPTAALHLRMGSISTSTTDYRLGHYDETTRSTVLDPWGTDYIQRLLRLFAVDELPDIEGQNVTALFDRPDPSGRLRGLQTQHGVFMFSDYDHAWGIPTDVPPTPKPATPAALDNVRHALSAGQD